MAASSNPDVSILVPVFNVEPFLRQCLDSLINQTWDNIEIILIDDGSTDGCPSIINEYKSSDSRIRVISKQNSGYGDSLNRGLNISQGEWIAIVEPDDWAAQSMCEVLLNAAKQHEKPNQRIDIVKGAYCSFFYDVDEPPVETPSAHLEIVKPAAQPFTVDENPELLCLHPSIWTALYRKAFLDEFGIRFKPIPGAGWADNPFFIETLVAARSIVYLNEVVYHYQERDDGTISHLKNWRTIVDRWFDMCDVLNKYDVAVPAILEGHYHRGCSYIEMLYEDFGNEANEVNDAIESIARTIDFDVVRRSRLINWNYKLAYSRTLPVDKRLGLLSSWLWNHILEIFEK